MEVINLSPHCSAGQSLFYTNEALGISTINYASSEDQLLLNMRQCFQFKDVDMYEHGLLVNREYVNIITSLNEGLLSEVLPTDLIDLYKNKSVLDFSLMMKYQILHDCGKPLCREVDEEKRVHYPEHAKVSHQQIVRLFPEEIDLQYLVLHDMDFHTLKPDQLKELAESKYGFSLYLTAWAELMANATMFNGFDSVSFKIKRKHLVKCMKLFK